MLRQSQTYWIERLKLQAHPEGGYFSETYRSEGDIPKSVLPDGFTGSRSYSTAIYFLLPGSTFSAFHRIESDELWHFYDGNPLSIFYFDHNDTLREEVLGNDLERGQSLQVLVPAGVWFASRCHEPEGFTLAGCTVAPGFDFEDFTLARADDLLQRYPNDAEIIHTLTRQ